MRQVLAYVCFLSVLVLILWPFSLMAQQSNKSTGCEKSSGLLDYLLDKTTETDTVIVISHLGHGDLSKFNDRRLHNVRAYLTEYMPGKVFVNHPSTLVLASGERTVGNNGSLEIYFNGKLWERLYVAKNEDLYVGECAVDLEVHKNPCDMKGQQVFYPCRR